MQLLSRQMLPYVVFLIVLPALVILSVDITFRPRGTYLLASSKLFLLCLACRRSPLVPELQRRASSRQRVEQVHRLFARARQLPVGRHQRRIQVAEALSRVGQAKSSTCPAGLNRRATWWSCLQSENPPARGTSASTATVGRNTNPVLKETDGLHLLNGIAKRGSTLNALPEILEKGGVKLPTIVSRLGIPTSCYVNYTLYDNCASVGEVKVSQCRRGGKCYDDDVIPLLEEDLGEYVSGNRFVVLHLGGGSHGPVYSDRHPPEFRLLKPMCNDADVANQCTLEQLYNSYDNTILFVDHVLGGILQALDRSGAPYVFIYLSDHGESLRDEGRMFHGMPPGIPLPPEQAQIPLIVKSSVPISIVERAEYHQPDVFDTVLDLFSIETPLFDKSGSFIKLGARPIAVARARHEPSLPRAQTIGRGEATTAVPAKAVRVRVKQARPPDVAMRGGRSRSNSVLTT